MSTDRLKELKDGIDSVGDLLSISANLNNTISGHWTALSEHLYHCTRRLLTTTTSVSATVAQIPHINRPVNTALTDETVNDQNQPYDKIACPTKLAVRDRGIIWEIDDHDVMTRSDHDRDIELQECFVSLADE